MLRIATEGSHLANVVVASMEEAKERAVWGTFGKGGVEHCAGGCPEHQLTWKRLIDCKTEHLQAILRTQYQIQGHCYTEIIHSILKDRGVKPAKFSPEASNRLYSSFYRRVNQ